MATSSSVILLIVAGSFLGAAYGGDKLHVPPAQDISSFTFQLRTIYGNSSLSNGSLDTNMTGGGGEEGLETLRRADDNLNIYALPVGQGDCTVIQCPKTDGDKITIIDAGSSKKIGFKGDDLVKFLRLGKDGVTIKSIFLTHPDKDHINYIDAILKAYGKKVPVYHSCEWSLYSVHVKSEHAKKHADHKIVSKCCGKKGPKKCRTSLKLCTHATLNVIASGYNDCRGSTNGDSIVSIITYKRVRTLLPGDFEGDKTFMKEFLDCVGREDRSDLRADIFRLSHHGAYNNNTSKLTNTKEFLDAVKAQYVFSSSGFNNHYKHPRCELYDHYHENGIANVTSHKYSCYNTSNTGDTTLPNYDTTDAIYATTIKLGGISAGDKKNLRHYVIHFSINETGHITSKAWPT